MTEEAATEPTILIVEDDEDIAFLLRFLLERNGFHVDHRSDGRAALEAFTDPPPALVVLDYMLPYHDGVELLERLRALPAWAAVPVVMLTAKTREQDIVRAFDAGADDYLTKPFQPDELLARVRRLLRRSVT